MEERNKKLSVAASIRARHLPYPYVAGLAICSDIDDCTLDTFIQIHRYLNSEKYGLGLPVSDSFFPVANDSEHMAYYNRDGSIRSEEAEFIRQAIHDGLIDSLHSWGDFNAGPPRPDFLKLIADNLSMEFYQADLSIPIWINHGSPNNFQNLFSRLFSSYQGDDPRSSFYTMPHIKRLGVKYFWWSELLGWPLSAKSANGFRKGNRIFTNKVKNLLKYIIGKANRVRPTIHLNDLAVPVTLRDGSALVGFTRFAADLKRSRLWWPDRNTLRYSLAESVLENLMADRGYLIVYTHLAKPGPGNDRLFTAEDEKVLKHLAEKYREGHIWVASTATLLNYWFVNRYVEWQVRQDSEYAVIDITGIDDPLVGPRRVVEKELAGLCFYTSEPLRTLIRLHGEIILTKIFPPDDTGYSSVGFDIPGAPATNLVD